MVARLSEPWKEVDGQEPQDTRLSSVPRIPLWFPGGKLSHCNSNIKGEDTGIPGDTREQGAGLEWPQGSATPVTRGGSCNSKEFSKGSNSISFTFLLNVHAGNITKLAGYSQSPTFLPCSNKIQGLTWSRFFPIVFMESFPDYFLLSIQWCSLATTLKFEPLLTTWKILAFILKIIMSCIAKQ